MYFYFTTGITKSNLLGVLASLKEFVRDCPSPTGLDSNPKSLMPVLISRLKSGKSQYQF